MTTEQTRTEALVLGIPDLSLVLLVGASGSGKSTFARAHFKPTEVLSSDACRGMVSDDENDQSATTDAFEVLHLIAEKRLAAGRLTVIDATNVQQHARKAFLQMARDHHVLIAAIVFDLPESICHERNAARPDRAFGPHVVRKQRAELRRSVNSLEKEGFHRVHRLRSVADVDRARVERTRMRTDRRDERGPFDIVGDVHGCFDELVLLLDKLGYVRTNAEGAPVLFAPPEGRKLVFVGDLVDRGPKSHEVLRLAMEMVRAGHAICVPGNHEEKLLRWMRGKVANVRHGLERTIEQLATTSDAFRAEVETFIDGLVSHAILDDGKLVVAHAGLVERFHGRASGKVRAFCLYGQTNGEVDEYGLPVRYPWAEEYRGKAMVVYGHTPTPTADWINGTICIDQGCVFGGALTALRYPERELVQVEAAEVYFEPARPLVAATKADARPPGVLDVQDVSGRRVIDTRFSGPVTIRPEQAAPALESMTRFAIDPGWLVYLPPTMSPSATAPDGPYLEHPTQVFEDYRREGVARVICEEKHMGSRANLVICRDAETARARFGDPTGRRGVAWTRTGRAFFSSDALTAELVDALSSAMDASGLWDELGTRWVVLDAEIMPWSAKAQELIRRQYAAVGAAADAGLGAALAALSSVNAAGADELRSRLGARRDLVTAYRDAYRRYCWSVSGLAEIRVAPFHVLASESGLHVDRDHRWHMAACDRLADASPSLVVKTARVEVDLTSTEDEAAAIAWWEALTARGGEGMVVKPVDWIVRGRKGLAQPAIKCRGREYLRIIYGPEYTLPEHLERLRPRGLGTKRALALRESALGLEALARFVAKEPLYRVHECVFGVLALETEPVDPRL